MEEQRMMGREKGKRRLGNPFFKMADELIAEDSEISNMENRPFHRAYLAEIFTLSSRSLHSSPWRSIF